MSINVNPIMIFGAGHLGKIALDIFQFNKTDVYGILEEDESLIGKEVNHIPILGSSVNVNFLDLIGEKCDAFIAFDDRKLCDYTVKELHKKRKTVPINAVSCDAHIASDAFMGDGNLIMPLSTILSNTYLGNYNVISSGVVIGTSTNIKDQVNIGQMVSIGSKVTIGSNVFIGAGAIIIDSVNIEDNASIGAGSVVVDHVKKGQRIFGNPGKVVS